MNRRTWTATDPEPTDHPDLTDDLGEVWCWENDDVDQTCTCGQHQCTLYGSGWWSPTLGDGDLVSWSTIFTRIRDGRRATKVSELTDEESAELCREMFS